MPKFVIDEDMARSTEKVLKELGYDVKDIRDYRLRGAKDEEVYEFAQREQSVVLTGAIFATNLDSKVIPKVGDEHAKDKDFQFPCVHLDFSYSQPESQSRGSRGFFQ